jgi:hypothetical protein
LVGGRDIPENILLSNTGFLSSLGLAVYGFTDFCLSGYLSSTEAASEVGSVLAAESIEALIYSFFG